MSEQTDRVRQQLVLGLLRQLHLARMSERFPPRLVLAVFNLVNGGTSIALIAALALVTGEAFIFPSLGATAFLLFHLPLAEASSPRNALCGHLVGACCGWLGLWLFGLAGVPASLAADLDWPRVAAAGVSLGMTSALMVWWRIAHPPAGATALIVSLGLMPAVAQLPVLIGAVAMLTVQAFVLNRLAGIPYPLWRASAGAALPTPAPASS